MDGGGGGGKPYESSALKVTEGFPLESAMKRKRRTGTRSNYYNKQQTKYDENNQCCEKSKDKKNNREKKTETGPIYADIAKENEAELALELRW